MALVVCKYCKRAFINSLQGEEFCPSCTAKLKELYPSVRNFLRDNERRVYTPRELSEVLGVPLKDVEALVSMGLVGSDAPEQEQRKQSGYMHKYNRNRRENY
jgi:hypothetical protein